MSGKEKTWPWQKGVEGISERKKKKDAVRESGLWVSIRGERGVGRTHGIEKKLVL